MTADKLNEILSNHEHWIKKDVDGWENLKADLRNANLKHANLYDAILESVNLYGADLYTADLRDAYLKNVDLCKAHLRLGRYSFLLTQGICRKILKYDKKE